MSNETPLQAHTPRPLSQWTDDELEAFYKRLCPSAADLTTIDTTKPKKKRKTKNDDSTT